MADQLEECDCPYPGRKHFAGERDCILCNCPACQENESRSLFDLLPCEGVIVVSEPSKRKK